MDGGGKKSELRNRCFNHLRAFYEVAKTGSFIAAAKNLFLTQPAVAWQIKNLEEYYELKFFERTEKRVILTEEGKVLFDFSDRIFNLSRQAEEAISDLKGINQGTLRIDAVFTFGDYYLSKLVDAFHKKYPKIVIQINIGNTSQLIENTLQHKNDIAFVAFDPGNHKLVSRVFISDLLVGVVSPDHPLAAKKSTSLRDLNGQRLILREQGSSPRMTVDEILKKKGISPILVMESASTAIIKRAVESGMGMAILSRQTIRKEIQANLLKEVDFIDAEINYKFYLIHHKDKYFSRSLKAFMDVALELSTKLLSDE
jgi:DNA-binding transcriptional LysR family regulator